MNNETPQLPELTLGFTRGIAPSKWVRRWQAVSPEQALTIVPFAKPYGRPGNSDEFDMVLERTAPGLEPAGCAQSADPSAQGASSARPTGARHALKLYDEAVALVLPKDHELASEESVALADLAAIRLLDHPDHSPQWPAADPWEDPAWMPANPRAALQLVATGLGGVLLPAPLARHITDKQAHAVIRVTEPIAGATIWATWLVDRDAADMQQLAGVLRGRTARSSRGADHTRATEAAQAAKAQKRQQPAKAKPKLKPNSRGAQLQAATEKREREKAERRRAKRK